MKVNIKSSSILFIPEAFREELNYHLSELGYKKALKDENLCLPSGVIGQISTDNLSITISPNIPYLDTWDYLKLIDYNGIIKFDSESHLATKNAENISDYIIQKFIATLNELVHKGFPQKYKSNTIQSNHISGRINLLKSVIGIKSGLNNPISNVKTYLSNDYLETRVIKKAYQKLIAHDIVKWNSTIVKSLSKVDMSNLSITEKDYEGSSFSSQFYELNLTFELAVLILKNLSIQIGTNLGSASILINSNTLFEKFVYNYLKYFITTGKIEYHNEERIVARKGSGEELSCIPDILFKGTNNAVIDVKNKNFQKYFSVDDLYQLRVYLENFKSNIGILIYPNHSDDDFKEVNYLADENIKLGALGLNMKALGTQDSEFSQQKFICLLEEILNFS